MRLNQLFAVVGVVVPDGAAGLPISKDIKEAISLTSQLEAVGLDSILGCALQHLEAAHILARLDKLFHAVEDAAIPFLQ